MNLRFGIYGLVVLCASLFALSATAEDAQVKVRGADHEGFSRVVFDFATPTDVTLARADGRVELRISPAFDPEFVDGVNLTRIGDAEAIQDGPATIISFAVDPDTKLRHFKDGIALVLDAVDADQVMSQPAAPVADRSESLETPQSAKIDVATTQLQETESRSKVSMPSISELPDAAGGGRTVAVSASEGAQGYQISFDWGEAADAAVFTRAGILWIVFDRPAQFKLSPAAADPGRHFRFIERSSGDDYSFLRMALQNKFGISVGRDGAKWTVTLLDGRQQEPGTPIALTRQDTEADGFRIFMPYDQPGTHLRLTDPIIGDLLDVVPLANAGTGLATQRLFAEFKVLESAQGIVVAPISDRVIVNRYANGVAVGSMSNLAVSAPDLPRRFGQAEPSTSDNLTPTRLIDFAAWRLGDLDAFEDNRQKLERAISLADDASRNDRRWDYARFLLAHGFADESGAVLQVMREDNPKLVQSPSFCAVEGLAEIGMQKFDAAAESLSQPELDVEPEIWLWRGRAAEGLHHDQIAANYFDRGREALAVVSPERLGELELSALRAAIAVANSGDAQIYLNGLEKASLTSAQVAEATYLEGRYLELTGQRANALDRYAKVDVQANPKIAALARHTRLVNDLANNQINRDAAIEELEQLRYVWRGDEVERKVLKTLGELYLDAHQYRQGLETLRQLVSMTPDEDESRDVTERMSAAFRELFLDGAADSMPEVTALALYYDFRELTPLGQEGDQMIRRLSERLVSVDLLDHAADLLDHQVRFRLEGAAQAIVATRLAKIDMLNKKPQAALDIIRLTRQTDLPADVVRERKMVEARILTELGRYEEADVLVSNLSGGDVDRLRADIYWGWGKWDRLAEATAKLLTSRNDNQEPLSEAERQILLRHAIALSMQGNDQALGDLRQRYADAMKDGRFANAFAIITAPERASGTEISDIVRQTASVADLQSFMNEYRAEFISPPATGNASQLGGS